MADLDFQNFSTVQSNLQPKPNTIASTTAAIAPTTLLTYLSGTEALTTVTPPVTGQHVLIFVFTTTTPTTTVTTGNILNAVTPTKNVPVLLVYDPALAKYYAK